MLAFAGNDHGADVVGQCREEALDAEHRRIVERIALLCAREFQHRDRAVLFGFQRRRKVGPLR
jgi:hypothetical protein